MFEDQIVAQELQTDIYTLNNNETITESHRNQQQQQQYIQDNPDEKGFEKRIRIQPTFTFKRMDLPGIPKNQQVKKVVTSYQSKFVITKSNKIYRWRSQIQEEFKLIDMIVSSFKDNFSVSKKDKQMIIKNIFTDSRGVHTIIICQQGNNFYLHLRQAKMRPITQWKGIRVKTLVFHSPVLPVQNPKHELYSGEILYYEQNGAGISILKLQLFQNELLQTFDSSCVITVPSNLPITHIEIIKLSQTYGKQTIILISTSDTLYCLTSTDDIYALFKKYKDQKIKQYSEMQNMDEPNKSSQNKGAHMIFKIGYSKTTKRPLYIVWVNGRKCIQFKVPGPNQKSLENILNRRDYLKVTKRDESYEQQQFVDYPVSIGITDFNYYIVYPDCITIMSLITQRCVHVQDFKGTFLTDIVFDVNSSLFWIYESKNIYHLNTFKEGSEAWKFLVKDKRYRQAYNVCKSIGENVAFAAVLYADDLFEKKQYIKSAQLYIETSRTFQQIFLKFLQVQTFQARQGLIVYLETWLKKLQPTQQMQRCVIVTWVIQAYVHDISALQKLKQKYDPMELKNKLRQKSDDLHNLMQQNLDVLNFNLIYNIMTSHGRIRDMINFASSKNMIEVIVYQFIVEENYDKAIEYLNVANQNLNIISTAQSKQKQKDKRKRRTTLDKKPKMSPSDDNFGNSKVNEVIYKYAQIFFRFVPEKTVILLTKSIKKFNPSRMVNSIMFIPSQYRIHGVELLKYCILDIKSKDKGIHNLFIFFFVNQAQDRVSQIIELMKKDKLHFDLDFGLRLFINNKVPEAVIIIYGKLKQYSKAVSLALQNGFIQLAKQYANKPQSQAQKKQLWMEIAKYYLNNKNKMNQVIQLMNQSALLKIQDILPHFNANIKIQNFKEQICQSLQGHNNLIQQLNNLIKSYSSNAEQLKSQLKFIKNRCVQIDSSNKCEECFKTLFNSNFYMFPCLHGFHKECLMEAMKFHPLFTQQKMERIRQLEEQIRRLTMRIERKKQQQNRQINVEQTRSMSFMSKMPSSLVPTNLSASTLVSAAKNLWNKKQDLQYLSSQKQLNEIKMKKEQIDNIIASECVYCGPGIVDTIVMEFDNKQLKQSWKIGNQKVNTPPAI